MVKNTSCPHADAQESLNSLRCAVLKQRKAKWDFCVHQYFCRKSGRYKLNQDAANCELKESREE